jgi:hypothetical protein
MVETEPTTPCLLDTSLDGGPLLSSAHSCWCLSAHAWFVVSYHVCVSTYDLWTM